MISGWKDEIERDYLDFLRKHRRGSPPELAAHLNISERCATFWLTDLARDGKVRILAVELLEESTLPCDPETALSYRRQALCPVPEEAQVLG